jgi:hypothetical protein
MLNVSTFGNTADIYAIAYLVPYASAYHGRRPYLLLLSPSGKSGQLCARAFPLKTWKVSLSIGVIIIMIRCVVYLLLIFKMFHGLVNNPVYIIVVLEGRDNTKVEL